LSAGETFWPVQPNPFRTNLSVNVPLARSGLVNVNSVACALAAVAKTGERERTGGEHPGQGIELGSLSSL
jgi:hypothetical protein